jgi:hypothetical protein
MRRLGGDLLLGDQPGEVPGPGVATLSRIALIARSSKPRP